MSKETKEKETKVLTEKEAFIGKKVADFMTEVTEIKGSYVDSYDITEVVIRDAFIKKYENLMVVGDFMENLVLCFRDDKLTAVFNVYDLMHVGLNGERGLVKATGHETIHEYWFDDGEYSSDHTR